MSSFNVSYKDNVEKYKGKVIGFTSYGFAVVPEGIGLNAIDHCDCCGMMIHSQLTNANFCPVCAVKLGIIKEELARELCVERYHKDFERLSTDIRYEGYMIGLVEGFKNGIRFGVENAKCVMQPVKFDY